MNAPKLRFRGFKDEWKKVNFKNLFSERNVRTGEIEKYPLYSLTVSEGIVPKTDRYKRDFLVKKEDNFKVVYSNDFVSNPMNMTIGALDLYKGEKPVSVSGYYNVFTNDSSYGNYFLVNYLTSEKMIWRYKSIATGSLIEKQRVHYSQFIELQELLPSVEEAMQISNFLELLDKRTYCQQEKIDLLKEQKKGYMQKIFEQEIRFKDENNEEYPKWKKKVKTIELFEAISNKNPEEKLPVLSATQDQGMVLRDLLNKDMQYSTTNLNSYKIVDIDDFVISLRSFQGGIELSHLKGLVSPAYTIFRKKNDDVCNNYFKYLFKTETFINQLKTATYGIRDGKSISYKDFSTLKLDLPSYAEQQKIVGFLSKLDEKIQIEEKKLDSLKEQKKGFMQQMFI
ncbi:restriction endonuclease subunit S [Bacillus toyonensis]|uniref:restriction endonuclease subunit S n=1 Tax=Bacillus toyonensis TaxID=155322 RepID=UPI00027BEA03|nr:restriction endonuclease subunit S [Bacillus toyonensis]EJV52229.1 hypothetical protein IEA_00516 [Bacillus toyonensis]PHA97823.1 restriction endonuclease subunit S [Bacillus toyonensis]